MQGRCRAIILIADDRKIFQAGQGEAFREFHSFRGEWHCRVWWQPLHYRLAGRSKALLMSDDCSGLLWIESWTSSRILRRLEWELWRKQVDVFCHLDKRLPESNHRWDQYWFSTDALFSLIVNIIQMKMKVWVESTRIIWGQEITENAYPTEIHNWDITY